MHCILYGYNVHQQGESLHHDISYNLFAYYLILG